MRFSAVLVTVSFMVGLGPSARAQSLAEVAKKEEERRKKVPVAGKVFTNKDLKRVPEAATTPDPATSGGPTDAPGSLSVSGPTPDGQPGDAVGGTALAAQREANGEPTEDVQTEAYWRARMQNLRDQWDRNKTIADALESRVNGLTNDFASRDDPAQRTRIATEREKAMVELDRARDAAAAGPVEIAAAEEEARRAGVPPGWLR